MTNMFPPNEYGERRPNFERSTSELRSPQGSTVWIVLAAIVVVMLAIGFYLEKRTPTTAAPKETTQAIPGAVPPASPAPVKTSSPTP